ncbi:prolyl hydroxylase family protein [Paraliomyxa miuraensis]|uniref:prolyl hydroxylase family protein n=1 Tax=Paraliomyxa miuraensis TaxID=376150 RepID=UPI00224E1073|nr:2OG-Fe(II) oxygenase [Paraliomyxa miuraensis]MCX4239976.1 2OG-Fe(II) oxygenase [Paraliomyxa miuraensis]
MFAGHLDLGIPMWSTVDDVLSAEACQRYIDRFEAGEPHVAPVIRRDGVGIDEDVRNNERIMWDDEAEARAILEALRARLEATGQALPPTFRGGALVGANPRLRIYRYRPGQRHGAHWDTEVELDGGAILSRMTLVVYLNDGFSGGQTRFPELDATVSAKPGRALLFQHRLLHEACAVEHGTKYVLRTDVLYRAR